LKNALYKGTCSFFFLGYLPSFPGTWGTLGTACAYAAALGAGARPDHLFWGTAGAALAVSALAIPLGHRAREVFGKKDPGQFVLDEVAGYCVSLSFLGSYTVWTGGIAFLGFRLFDIWKPWPVRNVETWKGGWGIVLDDLLAGLLANQVVRVACLLIPHL